MATVNHLPTPSANPATFIGAWLEACVAWQSAAWALQSEGWRMTQVAWRPDTWALLGQQWNSVLRDGPIPS